MNGPEHYAEAERLLSAASFITHPGGPPVDAAASAHSAAAAQVHATLALTAAMTPRDVQLETDPGVAYVYRAAWGMTPLGTYTNAEAARKHCEADAITHNPPYETGHVFDWLEDEDEPDAAQELVVAKDGVEDPTEYTVTRLEVAAEYDPEADQ